MPVTVTLTASTPERVYTQAEVIDALVTYSGERTARLLERNAEILRTLDRLVNGATTDLTMDEQMAEEAALRAEYGVNLVQAIGLAVGEMENATAAEETI